jgi:hypothetical protein
MKLPGTITKAIEDGPNAAERFFDEWKRRETFATRIACEAYLEGLLTAYIRAAELCVAASQQEFAHRDSCAAKGEREAALAFNGGGAGAGRCLAAIQAEFEKLDRSPNSVQASEGS